MQAGAQVVTVGVGPLALGEVSEALERGRAYATRLQSAGLIHGAQLLLAGETRVIGSADTAPALLTDPS